MPCHGDGRRERAWRVGLHIEDGDPVVPTGDRQAGVRWVEVSRVSRGTVRVRRSRDGVLRLLMYVDRAIIDAVALCAPWPSAST
jgi:hypothetical protein